MTDKKKHCKKGIAKDTFDRNSSYNAEYYLKEDVRNRIRTVKVIINNI